MYLLSNGADADECPLSGEIKGFTPLIFAARENNEEIAQLLIDHGADVNARNMYGDSPLSLAEKEGHTTIVEILKANGAN
jgi:ankyrin repeat protein